MKKALVRCRCGHQVLAREVLRTDLYERSMGREYVYVKFRCKRCKRMGEAFVAENRWDWSILEPAPGEMNAEERDRFLDAEEISDADVEAFHRQLESLSDLNQLSQLPVGLPAGGDSTAPLDAEQAPDAEAFATEPEMGSAPHAPGSQSGGSQSGGGPSINPPSGSPKNATPSNATPSNATPSNTTPNANQASQKRPPSGDEKRPRS